MKSLKDYVKPYIKGVPLDTRYLFKKDIGNGLFKINLNSYPTLYFRKNSTDVKVFNQIFYWKEYDLINIDFTPKTIIDCGANIGMFAVWAKRRFPESRVISVEPSTANFEMLKMNTQELSSITLLQKGIWNKTTNLEIIDDGDGEWQFYTIEVPEPTPTSISAICINDIMQQYGMPEVDMLKIDIESAEKEVFEGDTDKWLPKVKVLVVELHDRMKKGCTKALFKVLDKYEYSMEVMGENLVITFHK